MFKHKSIWEILFGFVVFTVAVSCCAVVFNYWFSAKTFEGYYLHHNGMEYEIRINWDNAPDTRSFTSRDHKETLKVFSELTNK